MILIANFLKIENKKMKFKRVLIGKLKEELLSIIIFILLNLVIWSISLIIPYLTGRYIDNLIYITNDNMKKIMNYSLLFIFIGIINVLSYYHTRMLLKKLIIRIDNSLLKETISYIHTLSTDFSKNKSAAYLAQRISSDINSVVLFTVNSTIEIFMKLISLLFISYILLNLNFKIGILLIILLPVYGYLYNAFRKIIFQMNYEMKDNSNKYFSSINEQFSNMKFIKLNSCFEYLYKKLNDAFGIFFASTVKYTKTTSKFSSFTLIINRCALVILFLVGGIEVLNKRLTIGEFTIINNYFGILMSSLGTLLDSLKDYQEIKVSYSRIDNIYSEKQESNGSILINKIDTITISDLSFKLQGKNIFDGFNYEFKKDKIYTIIGDNGIGKTTLLNLLTGIYSDYSGSIMYDSYNIKQLDMYNLRENLIGIVEQEPYLFSDSIINNLNINVNRQLNDSELDKIINKLYLKKLIKSNLDGLNHQINNESLNLSGGEKQKISISRALVKNASIMIFDEPTSALDRESVCSLISILNEIKRNTIIITVTHDKTIIDISDEIINLDNLRTKK